MHERLICPHMVHTLTTHNSKNKRVRADEDAKVYNAFPLRALMLCVVRHGSPKWKATIPYVTDMTKICDNARATHFNEPFIPAGNRFFRFFSARVYFGFRVRFFCGEFFYVTFRLPFLGRLMVMFIGRAPHDR